MRDAIVAHLGTRQVSRVLYGSIIGLALVVALEAHPPPDWAIVVSLVATAIAVGLAELYSDVVGTETRTRARVEREQLAEMLGDIGAVMIGVAFPAIFFLLAVIGVFDVDTAFTVAKWSGLALITAYGYIAARFTGATALGAVRRAGIAGLIAAFLIVIKALLH
ncbi:MAG TPA: hypothetical protein VH683_10205 [Thermoleophilaceae bacterium]|jgi:hypothetical protein